MFRKYFSWPKLFQFLGKTKEVFSQKYHPLFHIHRIILKGGGVVEKKPLSTYHLMQLLSSLNQLH